MVRHGRRISRAERTPVVATVFGVWVEPALRGHGLGGRLVDAIVEWAVARGAERVQLWVTEDNDAARMLYERHGFVCTGERKACTRILQRPKC